MKFTKLIPYWKTISVIFLLYFVFVSACSEKDKYTFESKVKEYEAELSNFIIEDKGTMRDASFALSRPVSVECDSNNNIYVLDPRNSFIVKYSDSGKYVKHWGTRGIGPGRFPSEMTTGKLYLDSNGRLFVISMQSPLVNVFDTEGKFLKCFRVERPPSSLSVNKDGLIFISYFLDRASNAIIHVYNDTGKKITSFGDKQVKIDDKVLSLINPSLTIDEDSNMYVSFENLPFIFKYDKNYKLIFKKKIDFSGLRKYSYLKYLLESYENPSDGIASCAYGTFSKGIIFYNNQIYIDGGPQIWVLSKNGDFQGICLYPRDLGLIFMPSDLKCFHKNGEFLRVVNGEDQTGVALFKNNFQ